MLGLLGWVLVAGVLLILGLVVSLLAPTFDWKLWPIIRRARRELTKITRQRCPDARVFSQQGATKIDPRHLGFWITTDIDEERDRLRGDPSLHEQFCDALLRVGYPPVAVPLIHFFIQSQETVDRDYGGSWREAAESP